LVPLNCQLEGDFKPISIHVRKVYRDQFLRIRPELLTALEITDDPNAQLERHKEIYIKQPEGIVQTRVHVFSIDLSSALTYFHLDAKQPDSDTLWEPGTHKDKISLVLEKDTKPPRGMLYFYAADGTNRFNINRFAVVLSIGHLHPKIDIMLPPKHVGQLDVWWAKTRRGDRRSGIDKLSKKLVYGGASVSVELRKNGKLKDTQMYLVDIRVDPEGSLPWPDPDSDLTLTPFRGPMQRKLEGDFRYKN
jgi:hypothetical protein